MTKPQPLIRSAYLVLLALLAAFALSGCGGQQHYHAIPAPVPASYDNNMYASAVCVDGQGIRVPDNYCPVGDGYMNSGYGWRYHPYLASDPYQDVVYVGYPVGATYVTTRPARVSTLHIDRGRFPTSPPRGVRASSVRVPSLPVATRPGSSSVSRGGFGVPAAGTPLPTPTGSTFRAPAALPPLPARAAPVAAAAAPRPAVAPPAAAPAPKYAPRTSGGSSSSPGGWSSSRSSGSSGSSGFKSSGGSSFKSGK
jgi:uncharacterized membrane protein YgcG